MYWKVFKWAKEVAFDPRKNTKKDLKYGDFIRKLMVVSLVSGVLTTLLAVAGVFAGFGRPFEAGVFAIVVFLLSAIFQPFINAAIFHFFGKIVFRLMKGSYKKTYNATAYSTIPAFLFSWIPVIGSVIAAIWGVIVMVYALSNQQKISTGRAILVILIPIIIVVVIAAIIAAIVASFFLGALLGPSMMSSFLNSIPARYTMMQ